jgi:hypothetical protein
MVTSNIELYPLEKGPYSGKLTQRNGQPKSPEKAVCFGFDYNGNPTVTVAGKSHKGELIDSHLEIHIEVSAATFRAIGKAFNAGAEKGLSGELGIRKTNLTITRRKE